jgi:AraC-like DNA-binding protein
MADFDLLLRAATVALSFCAALAIALRRNASAVAPYAAFVVSGIGAFMIASAPGAHAALGLAAFFFNAWCLATPGVVWLLARCLFRDGGRHGPVHLLAIGALVCVTMAGDYGRYALGPLAAYPDLAYELLLAGRAAALALLFSAGAMALLHWREDLVEQRRRARAAFVAVAGAAFVALAASEFLFGGRGAPLEVLLIGHFFLLALAFSLLLLLARGGLADLLDAPAPVRPLVVVRADGLDAVIAQRVREAMATRRLWKREGMGIAELARELGTQEHRLRRAINRHLGYRNFNDFLHDYRLKEAAMRLADPAEHHLPVLSIALDCGYGSIGPFNRAFKARYGRTPGQFRNQPDFTRDSASRSATP